MSDRQKVYRRDDRREEPEDGEDSVERLKATVAAENHKSGEREGDDELSERTAPRDQCMVVFGMGRLEVAGAVNRIDFYRKHSAAAFECHEMMTEFVNYKHEEI